MDALENQRRGGTWETWLTALMLFAITAAAVYMAGKRWLPPLASEHGTEIDSMIRYLLYTTGALFVAGHVILGYFVWRFGRQRRVSFRMASPRAEWIWNLIPVVLMTVVAEAGVLILGLPVWGKIYNTPPPSDAVIVEVTGEQFVWNFRYPGGDGIFGQTNPRLTSVTNMLGLDSTDPHGADDRVVLGELHLPVNRPVRLRLRSKDVLHSFFLPHFRIKQDLVPGMTIEIWFVPTQTGTFEIACAELCGLGHFQMRGVLHVKTGDAYEEWLKNPL